MKKRRWAGLIASAVISCSAPDPAQRASSGTQSGGGSATGGLANSGGSGAGGSSGASYAGVAGAAGTTGGFGGSVAAAGASGGGSSGSSGSSSGSAGVSGSGGAATTTPPSPSDGCGDGGRPSNGTVTVGGDHIYAFPESYDGTTPMPMLLALHAYNNQETQLKGLTDNTALADDYVRVFPKSIGSGWDNDTDDKNRINAVFNEVLSNYCIDENRIFLTGHSSGAQQAVRLICDGDDRFKAIAPVAASKYCNSVDPIPAMYIQGFMDAQRGGSDGSDVVAVFTSSNGCDSTTSDYPVDGCNSSFNGKPVDPGCSEYQGCSEPTVWCSHNDEGYNGTDGHYHGWPCFASEAMAGFFSSLP